MILLYSYLRLFINVTVNKKLKNSSNFIIKLSIDLKTEKVIYKIYAQNLLLKDYDEE